MQHVRIAKSIELILVVAASLLLCTAQTFAPSPKLYRAKPEDVPPLGRAGEFSFYPDRRRTNRELEGRADLVGQKVQRRREGRADPHL